MMNCRLDKMMQAEGDLHPEDDALEEAIKSSVIAIGPCGDVTRIRRALC